jgi:AAA+ superfamily predicted ATPase
MINNKNRLDVFINTPSSSEAEECLDGVVLALTRLDIFIGQALTLTESATGRPFGSDPFRGLHISPDDAQATLSKQPVSSLFGQNNTQKPISSLLKPWQRLTQIKEKFDLTDFDLDVIVIALATELDLRYERLYAYLQDDITRKRPTVDLALNLLCHTTADRIQKRSRFLSDAPLFKGGLLELVADSHQVEPSLLSRYIKPVEQLSSWLIGSSALDERLESYAELVNTCQESNVQSIALEKMHVLTEMITEARSTNNPLTLYFRGDPGVGKRTVAESLACVAQAPLLVIDLTRLLTSNNFDQLLKSTFFSAKLQNALLYFRGMDNLRASEQHAAFSAFLDQLLDFRGVVVLAGSAAWTSVSFGPTGIISIAFGLPSSAQRKAYWEEGITKLGLTALPQDIDIIANRFKLSPRQITDAVASLRGKVMPSNIKSGKQGHFTFKELSAVARAQSGYGLQRLATKIEPRHIWDDLILPEDTKVQLRELCDREMQRERVLGEWGFDQKLSLGKGNAALFSGTPGTGKTMAAEVISNELGLDLYKIDLSRIVNKYIGETEKNLDLIFSAAEDANAILFFDEADALFGKRTDVRDSHDRYANLEVSYLLQKMEEYDGLAILATNLRDNMDEAFMRRLAFSIYFPFPDDIQRLRIWQTIWPKAVPLDDEVDLDFMAREVKVGGGSIKNIALSAAYLAAADDSRIVMSHLIQAANREFEKLGRSLSIAEYQVQSVAIDNPLRKAPI